MKFTTDEVIENMVDAACGNGMSAREKLLYRESLRNLVRMAKAEGAAEMKANVDKLTDSITARIAKRRAKALLMTYRLSSPMPNRERCELNRD